MIPILKFSNIELNMILFCWFSQIEMESVDVDSEIDEILKKAQEATPEGNDASDIGTSKTPNA